MLQKDVRHYMEGAEHCKAYIKTGKIEFGSSTLLPGQKGDVNKGHPHSQEVFFILRGSVLLHLGDKNEYYELEEQGDFLMPEGVPHMLINIGEETAVVTWSLAPSE